MNDKKLPVKVKISADVLFQQMNEEGVLLDMATEQYFGLDDIALRVWQLLSEDEILQNAVDKLLTEYDVTEEVLHKDLITTLQQLESNKLITLEY